MPTVDVHAEGEQATGDELCVLDEGAIAGRLLLFPFPIAERVCAGRHYFEAVGRGQFPHLAANAYQLLAGLFDILADRCARDRSRGAGRIACARRDLFTLTSLPAIVKESEPLGGSKPAQIPAVRIDKLIFFFDGDAEGWLAVLGHSLLSSSASSRGFEPADSWCVSRGWSGVRRRCSRNGMQLGGMLGVPFFYYKDGHD